MLGVFGIREENVSDNNCRPTPDVLRTGGITKAEMSIQAHRWLFCLQYLLINHFEQIFFFSMSNP